MVAIQLENAPLCSYISYQPLFYQDSNEAPVKEVPFLRVVR
jgi:hypothetical protein